CVLEGQGRGVKAGSGLDNSKQPRKAGVFAGHAIFLSSVRWSRSCGKIRLQMTATAMAPNPPITTAATGPMKWATVPALNSPSSLEAPINTELTALTRPRTSSGVQSCMMVSRMVTLTMSEAPTNASAGMESQMEVEKPNTTVKAPASKLADGKAGEKPRHGDGTQARRRTQRAIGDPAAMENIGGIDREHGNSAPHQHGKHVERDGAQHDLVAEDIAKAAQKRF